MALPATKFKEESFVEERERLAKLESNVGHIDKTLTEVKGELRDLNKKVDELKDSTTAGFKDMTDKNNTVLMEIRRESSSNFKWLLGAFGGGVVFLAGLVYFLFNRISVP